MPAVLIPPLAPKSLQTPLEELGERARAGNLWATALALRDALSYTTRLFAGVSLAACREFNCAPPELPANWGSTTPVSEAEELLRSCLKGLQGLQEKLARAICDVFYEGSGPRPFARELGLGGEGEAAVYGVGAYCAKEVPENPDPEEVSALALCLNDWMVSSISFFLESEDRYEQGLEFGSLEQVFQFRQHILRTGLTLTVRESRESQVLSTPSASVMLAPASAPPPPAPIAPLAAPVAPEGAPIAPLAAPVAPEGAPIAPLGAPIAPEGAPIAPLAAPVAPAGSQISPLAPEAEPRSKSRPKSKVKPPSKAEAAPEAPTEAPPEVESPPPAPPAPLPPPLPPSAITEFISDKLTQEPEAPLERRSSADEPQPIVEVKFDYMGYAKNSAGKMGHAGVIWINNRGGGELIGTVYCTNDFVEVNPKSFQGDSNRLTFWIDPNELPQPEGSLVVRTATEERRIPCSRMVPSSRLSELSFGKMLALLLAPGLIGSLYITFVLWSSGLFIQATIERVLGDQFNKFFAPGNYMSMRTAGVGALDLDLMPRAEACALLMYLLAWMAPLAVAKIFVRYPRYQQKALGWAFMLGMTLPVFYFLALWKAPLLSSPLYLHPELAFANFRTHMTGFLAINLIVSMYLFASVAGVFNKFLNELGKMVLSLVLFVIYAISVGFMVYGRSWFATS